MLSVKYGLIYIFAPLNNCCSQKLLRTLTGQLAFSPLRPAVHVFNSQSVLESGWFFPPFDRKLMAQPSWALGVPGNEKM